jgi:hypothetical protein
MRFIAIFITVLLFPAQTQAQQQPQSPSSWPCGGNVDPTYVRMAEATGGTVLPFHPTEAGGAGAEMVASMRHKETVFRAGGQVAEGLYEFGVPVDSTIDSIYFLVSLQCLQIAEILTPSGDKLNVGAAGVEYHHFEAIRLFVVPKPTPGFWKVTIGGRGLLTLVVKAKTDLRLSGVTFQENGAPLTGESKLGKALRLEAMTSGTATDVAFQFVGSNAAAIQAFGLTLEDELDDLRTYAGDVLTPRMAFRVAVTGVDPNGFRFQRVQEQLLMPDR